MVSPHSIRSAARDHAAGPGAQPPNIPARPAIIHAVERATRFVALFGIGWVAAMAWECIR